MVGRRGGVRVRQSHCARLRLFVVGVHLRLARNFYRNLGVQLRMGLLFYAPRIGVRADMDAAFKRLFNRRYGNGRKQYFYAILYRYSFTNFSDILVHILRQTA